VPECPPADAASTSRLDDVFIDPTLVQNMGVKTAVIERRDLARSIRAVGRVTYDERRVHHVHTKIHGWIEMLYVEYEGGMVKAGQPLLEIYSPELVSTQEELLLAARYRDDTQASLDADVRRSGQDLLDAARRRLELWDIPKNSIDDILSSGEIRKTVTLYAPQSGVVTHLNVRHGMEVTSDKNLYTIADLSRVWIYANVYEYELPWLEVGRPASVQLDAVPGASFAGLVSYIYPFLDPETRTARLRLELDNPDMIFKPDMFANVEILAADHPDALAVPEEAVIRSGRRALVIVDLGGGHFAPRDVTLGIDTGDGWLEVLQGLEESERVVTSGQFLIDSESKLRAAAQKLLAAESN
jgi:multidrug efflux pump subunit AcrA (membrane-fusion protein)